MIAYAQDPAQQTHRGPSSFAEDLEAMDVREDLAALIVRSHEKHLKRDALYHASFAVMQIIDRVRDVGYLPALLCYELGVVTAQNPTEIAARFGVSKQAIHQVRDRIQARLPLERWVITETKADDKPTPLRPGRGFVDMREASALGRIPMRVLKGYKADGLLPFTVGLDGQSHWYARGDVRRLARGYAISCARANGAGRELVKPEVIARCNRPKNGTYPIASAVISVGGTHSPRTGASSVKRVLTCKKRVG